MGYSDSQIKELQEYLLDPFFRYPTLRYSVEERQKIIENREGKELTVLINEQKIPPILYKYRSAKETFDIIRNSHIKFSTISEFSDPFEGAINVDLSCNSTDFLNFVEREKIPTFISNNQNIVKEQVERAVLLNFQKLKTSTGIFSTTPINNNILMWSYYADEHKGFCLGFDIRKQPELFAPLRFMNYTNSIPSYNPYINSKLELPYWDAISNKSLDWSYEREYRTVKHLFHGFRKFEKESLTCVIIGMKTPQEDIVKLHELLLNGGYIHAKVFRATKNDHKYGIQITTNT